MPGGHPALLQRARDQEAAVAIERVVLRAQQRDAVFPRPLDHAREAALEPGGGGHALVVGDAVAIAAAIPGAAAQLLAQEGIGEAIRAQPGLEGCPAEVREAAGMG